MPGEILNAIPARPSRPKLEISAASPKSKLSALLSPQNGSSSSSSSSSSSLVTTEAIAESLELLSPRSQHPARSAGRSSRHFFTSSTDMHSPTESSRELPRIHNKLGYDRQRVSSSGIHLVKLHTQLAETANGVRRLAKNLTRATIQIAVRNIMIVTKARDNSLVYLTREMVEWLLEYDDQVVVFVDHCLQRLRRFRASDIVATCPRAEQLLRYWNKKLVADNPELFDLVVTLGGDGTVLFVLTMFQQIVPPVVLYALGSLGFLTNFRFDEFRKNMQTVLDAGVRANLRMRLACRVYLPEGKIVCERHVLNEVVIDRGPSPFVTNLELYGDGLLLTIAQADGLIIATPTGLTAYSLSAGGSLVHPGVSAISVTPICPHTLSFRPILLPDGMVLKVKVPNGSRAHAWASFDGKERTELKKGYHVTIQALLFPFPTVIALKTEYIDLVSHNLNWNAREQQKTFSDYLSADSRRKFCSKRKTLNGSVSSLRLEVDPAHDDDFDINFDPHLSDECCLTDDEHDIPGEDDEKSERKDKDDEEEDLRDNLQRDAMVYTSSESDEELSIAVPPGVPPGVAH